MQKEQKRDMNVSDMLCKYDVHVNHLQSSRLVAALEPPGSWWVNQCTPLIVIMHIRSNGNAYTYWTWTWDTFAYLGSGTASVSEGYRLNFLLHSSRHRTQQLSTPKARSAVIKSNPILSTLVPIRNRASQPDKKSVLASSALTQGTQTYTITQWVDFLVTTLTSWPLLG